MFTLLNVNLERQTQMRATAKDMRFHTREILDAVSRGEEVVITFRGRPKAKIVPLRGDRSPRERPGRLFGIWSDHPDVDSVDVYIRKIRIGRLA